MVEYRNSDIYERLVRQGLRGSGGTETRKGGAGSTEGMPTPLTPLAAGSGQGVRLVWSQSTTMKQDAQRKTRAPFLMIVQ